MPDRSEWPPAAPGARRIFDRWAWVREFTKPAGPDSVTRLVLFAMAAKMNEDGTRCTVGARGLADLTGLCKTTACKHRGLAVELGWLLPPSVGRHAARQEWLPSVPASVHCPDNADTAEGPALSYTVGQQEGNPLSYAVNSTVLRGDVHCPTPWDIPASYQPYNQPGAAPRAPGSKAGPRARATERRTAKPWEQPPESELERERRRLLELAPVLKVDRYPGEPEASYVERIRRENDARIARTGVG